ncbi:hypothetical protein SAMN05518672_108206 [Chitinophaga sp. CF118]|uniref:hypothetical protein n=1 Tax=Chitinophaga sp. CF118 TaxID=1884367 RepID=UPI0008EB0B14|nr:hypothetical protein [Chitinophaga sp. CF118]SFE64061.1 hypothetical protein SAMN05518672_108206 [Chitinophaga sp. CF118]
MKINTITFNEIKLLKPDELVDLLQSLLNNEVSKHFSLGTISNLSVPKIINVADGGEDGRLEFDLGTDINVQSQWIKQIYTCFQSKAQNLSNAQVRNEILVKSRKKRKEIKPQILKCLDASGEYVIFISHPFTDNQIEERIKKIRSALSEANYADAANAKIRIIDGNKIANWTNEYISAVTLVQKFRNMTRLDSFLTWTEWKKLVDGSKGKYDYQEPTHLSIKSQQILSSLLDNRSVRVIGHKGIGKTRLVLETFNPGKGGLGSILSGQLVYIDIAIATTNDLSKFLISHNDMEGLIIIDNCSDQLHEHYASTVKIGTKFKIVTINDSFEQNNPEAILLNRYEQRETVRLMFKNCFTGFSESMIEHFLKISEGFPEMVQFIETAFQSETADVVFNTIPENFIKKFVFGSSDEDKLDYDLLKACSVFTNFIYIDDENGVVALQREKDMSDLQIDLITTHIVETQTTRRAFYKFWKKYSEKRNLFERRGFFYSVIPEPIAVHLAAEWWDSMDFASVKDLLKQMEDCQLLVPLTERLKLLDQSESAKKLVAKIWGPNGPFATAEAINSKLGSRLFRSVVEVNPTATLESLEAFFESYDLEGLRINFKAGRRNIVWALEKIVFRKEYFLRAGKILFKVAIAENEDINNNATSQVLQLFHYLLPGTEADLKERMSLLTWAIGHENKEYNLMGLKALGHCLKAQDFRRIGGAEFQGGFQQMIDYKPKVWEEVYVYWNTALDYLARFATGEDENVREIAQGILAANIRGLLPNSQSVNLFKILHQVIEFNGRIWDKALESFSDVLRFDKDRLLPEEIISVETIVHQLQPKDTAGKFKIFVSSPILDIDFGHDFTDYNEVGKSNAEKFALEVAENLVKYEPYFYNILRGEQRQGLPFGYKLATLVSDQDQLFFDLLNALRSIKKEEQNASVIAGLLSAVDDDKRSAFLSAIISDNDLYHHSFELTRISKPTIVDLFNLFELVDSGKANINVFETFIYGRVLDHFETDDVLKFTSKVESYPGDGPATAFKILGQYVHQSDDKWKVCKTTIRALILKHNFFSSKQSMRSMDIFQMTQCITRILNDDKSDTNLVKGVSVSIYKASLEYDFNNYNSYLGNLCSYLVQNYFDIFWMEISDAFINEKSDYLNLKFLLGVQNGSNGHNGILFSGELESFDTLIGWCRNNQPKGPKRIAYLMPTQIDIDGKLEWHPFALRFIEEFGHIEKLLGEISANIDSYSSYNYSAIAYHEGYIQLMNHFVDHHNSNIRDWARKSIEYYRKCVLREKLDRDQDFIGR